MSQDGGDINRRVCEAWDMLLTGESGLECNGQHLNVCNVQTKLITIICFSSVQLLKADTPKFAVAE